MKVAIAGGGIAGLTAGLLLARGGHHVDLFETDAAPPPEPAAEAFLNWDRRGVGQCRMPHQFLARIRQTLQASAPDVLEGVLAAGATENEVFRKIPGGTWLPEDEALVSILVRRPVFEAVLRHGALHAGVLIHAGVRVAGILLADGATRGVRTTSGDVEADLVVDATGRRTPVARWLSDHGMPAPEEEHSDCAVVYYCRHYQLRPGVEYPDTVSPTGGPLGDLGSLRFNLMRGDNRTHTILLGATSSDRGFRELRHAAAFEAALRLVPPLLPYLEPGFAMPITDVLAMGDLQNVRRRYMRDDMALVPGLVGIGDSYCHTDPLFGWGASFAVAHGAALAEAVAHADRPADINQLVEAAIGPEADAAYRASTEEDHARDREWRGISVEPDPITEKGTFIRKVVAPCVPFDPIIFRALFRRVMLLDPPEQIYTDREVQQRALALAPKLAEMPRPFAAPTRDELGAAIDGALSSSR